MQEIDGFECLGDYIQVAHGDCLQIMQRIPAGSCNLIFADPPYNVNLRRGDKFMCTQENWDKAGDQWHDDAGYMRWMFSWIKEATRCAKPNASFLMWHNNMPFIARFMCEIEKQGGWDFCSFVVWQKPCYRQQASHNAKNRQFFSCCEYLLHFTRATASRSNGRHERDALASEKILAHYGAEMERLGISRDDIAAKYREAFPKNSGAMLSHYLTAHQFVLPTREVWQKVFAPLGFRAMRDEYDALRDEYDAMRFYFDNTQGNRGNFYSVPSFAAGGAFYHPAAKPVDMLADMILKTCPIDGLVLDPFAGIGSAAIAAQKIGRRCIAIERDDKYFADMCARIKQEQQQPALFDVFPSKEKHKIARLI